MAPAGPFAIILHFLHIDSMPPVPVSQMEAAIAVLERLELVKQPSLIAGVAPPKRSSRRHNHQARLVRFREPGGPPGQARVDDQAWYPSDGGMEDVIGANERRRWARRLESVLEESLGAWSSAESR